MYVDIIDSIIKEEAKKLQLITLANTSRLESMESMETQVLTRLLKSN